MMSLQVMEYLAKKGYTKTESMLRLESSTDRDGRPLFTKADAEPHVRYTRGFGESHLFSLIS